MRVLFLDTVHPILWEKLEQKGCTCVADYACTYAELLTQIPAFDGVVLRSRLKLDRTFFTHAKGLRFIARSGAGLENIDLDTAEEHGVAVVHSPEGNRRAVAEHALGMALALLNHTLPADREVRKGVWKREKNRGRELSSMTIGIIGYGYMGKAFAQILNGFGCTILAHDKYQNKFGCDAVQEASLEEIQHQAHLVSLHLPETPETYHYINDDFIREMVHPFYLLNTARGKHVDLTALLTGINTGKVLGAGLDVLEVESSSFSQLNTSEALPELTRSDKVLFSPHVAGWTIESYEKLSAVLFEKLEQLFFTDSPEN